MHILVQPMYSKAELNADSNYIVYTSLINGMRSVRPDWHFVVFFPDAKSGYKYEDDGFFLNSNVTRIPQRISTRKMANAVSFNAGWYDNLFREFGFDAVWCNLVEIAAQIKMSGAGTLETKARPQVVAAHNYVIHDTLPYTFEAQAHVAYLQAMGALISDHNVFNSHHCLQMFRDTAQKWLRADVIAEIESRSTLINYGTLDADLEYQESGNDIPVIAYNHRLQAYKDFARTFEILNELYKEGLKFRVRYMNNTAENLAKISSYPFVEVVLCETRVDYLTALRGCDLNVTNSLHETFCISAIESMALGQPLIAPDGVTFPEITGSDAGNEYPFLFNNADEQKQHLSALIRDAALRQKWGKIVSEHVTSNYNQHLWAENYAGLFDKIVITEFNTAEDALGLIRDALEKNAGADLRTLYNACVGNELNGRTPFGNQSLPLTKLVKLVRQIGGRVEFEGGKQIVYPA